MSVISDRLVKKWKTDIHKGLKVKLTGFNNSCNYSDSYVNFKIFDENGKYFIEAKFLIVQELTMDVIIGFNYLKNYQIITEKDYMVLENDDYWLFRRNIPEVKISAKNKFIPPGKSILNLQVTNLKKEDAMITLSNENLEPNGCNVVISQNRKNLYIPVMNLSNRFINTEKEKICEIEEINQKILELNKPIPPHHRRSKKLPKLDLSKLIVNKNVGKEYVEKLKNLLRKYHHNFSRDSADIGTYSGGITYTIELTNDIKETYKGRNFKGHERNFIRNELKKLIENKIVCEFPTDRVYCGLTCAMKKSPEGQKLRLCLNSTIQFDRSNQG